MADQRSRCDWRLSGRPCQFRAPQFPEIQLRNGAVYCPLHTPCRIHERNKHDVVGLIKHAISKGVTNFDGVCFPDDKDIKFTGGDDDFVTFRDCEFGNKFSLELQQLSGKASVLIEAPTMRGRLTIRLPAGEFNAANCEFSDKLVLIPSGNKRARQNFRRAIFRKPLAIEGRLSGVWDFSFARFLDATKFAIGSHGRDLVEDDATVTFFGAHHSKSSTPPNAEGSFRLMREAFSEVSDRDNEAVFYRLEKRSQRFGLRPGFTRALSALYDFLSSYGSSYIKPFNLFWMLQVVAALVYAGASNRNGAALWPDATIIAFTLAQVAKPFEFLGIRAPSSLVAVVVGNQHQTWWAFATFVHGALSLALFAMFLLAIRWRFKRN